MVAIRPDDLQPTADGPISATVEIAEYHGRDFYAVARGADGAELYFRSDAAAERRRGGAARRRAIARAGLSRRA